jgi:hypothetical protein
MKFHNFYTYRVHAVAGVAVKLQVHKLQEAIRLDSNLGTMEQSNNKNVNN